LPRMRRLNQSGLRRVGKTMVRRSFLATALGLASSLLLAGCDAGFAALRLVIPKTGYRVVPGQPYGADPRQMLDIYIPEGLQGPAPVLVFFYGGAWQGGSRADYFAFGQAFASQGIVTVVADYRLYPQVTYPTFVEDGAAALAWVRANIARHGGDAARIFLSGHSAGGYIAVMLGAEPAFVKARGGGLSWIRGVIGIAGPYDFLPLRQDDYIAIFHGANNRDAMPVNHVTGKRPPMLLAWGTGDATVGPANIDHMEARLKAVGSVVETRRYPGVGHVGIILSLAHGFRGRTTLHQDMLRFIRSG
jgi:acetyl esterase/lipase